MALALVVFVVCVTGCLGGGADAGDATNGATGCGGAEDFPNEYHGLLGVSETTADRSPIVPVSNETVQSTEPIVTLIDRYRENGTEQQMGVDCDRFNESLRALQTIDDSRGGYVALDDGTVLAVTLASNETV